MGRKVSEGSVGVLYPPSLCTSSPLDSITGVLSSTWMFIGFTPGGEAAQIWKWEGGGYDLVSNVHLPPLPLPFHQHFITGVVNMQRYSTFCFTISPKHAVLTKYALGHHPTFSFVDSGPQKVSSGVAFRGSSGIRPCSRLKASNALNTR